MIHLRTLAAMLVLSTGCLGEEPSDTELAESAVVAASAADFAGYWANGYDARPGAIRHMTLDADGRFRASIATGTGNVEETGTWSLTGTGTRRTLALASTTATRRYRLSIVQLGTPVWPSNPTWNAHVRLTSPLEMNLFGIVAADP